jgi:hypothetical protein
MKHALFYLFYIFFPPVPMPPPPPPHQHPALYCPNMPVYKVFSISGTELVGDVDAGTKFYFIQKVIFI